jgi:V/A-type H+-transporting ATPase subunit I
MMAAALAAIFTYSWQHNRPAPNGERLLIALMEGFEAAMSYISNTLSFLRLAAFSLNHVALSLAIFTVADMLQATGYWITVVLGNLFILILEGGIVAIQTLRLEYYEGFSRFFGGDGRAFRPLTLGSRKQLAIKI